MEDRFDMRTGLESDNASKKEKEKSEKENEKDEELYRRWSEKKSFAAASSREKGSRDSSIRQASVRKEEVVAMYQKLEEFLKSEDFEEDFKKVLEISNPNYLKVLEKRRRDIERADHGIVVAGETSAGKSTLINKILEKRLFKGRNLESTSTVCKIRNSESARIIIENVSGEKDVIDLSECDVNTDEGLRKLRSTLKDLTDMTLSKESKQYRSVDIGFPIPLLKGDTILVDTPGIGGSGEVSQKLMDYLPNALSFVFVINVASAGGMQRDRLPEILRSLIHLKIDDEMPCFDPRDVIFVTNKWDTIPKEESDSEEEDEETKTWKNIRTEIKEKWPAVNEEYIYKLSLTKVLPNKMNDSVQQFKEFQNVLMINIEKAESARVTEHLRFLQELLRNITKNLKARRQLYEKSIEEQNALTEKHQQEIDALRKRCKEVEKNLKTRISVHIETSAEVSYKYVSSSVGRNSILHPAGMKSIMDVCDDPEDCAKEVNRRFTMYVDSYLKSEKVVKEFTLIQKDTETFYKETSLKLYHMEMEWTEIRNKKKTSIGESQEPSAFEIAAGIFLLPFALPLIVFALAVGIVTVVAAPFIGFWNWLTGIEEKKREAINKQYEQCTITVRKTVTVQLKTNAGSILEKLIDKVTVQELPKRIGALEEMINQLQKKREKIIAKRHMLESLASNIKDMEEDISQLQKKLKENE